MTDKKTVYISVDTPLEIIKAFPEFNLIFLVDDVATYEQEEGVNHD